MTAYRYRDELLRRIDKQRNGEGFRGARVLMLGVPFGKSRIAAEPLAESTVDPSVAAADPAATGQEKKIDQTEILAQTFVSLLMNSALNYRDWHDPSFALPEDFASGLDQYDCAVVFQDDPRYDLEVLREKIPTVLDARDSAFAQGDPTAKQQKWPISVTYTGLVPIVYKAQRTLLASLIQSTGWAFVAISIVMMVLLRNPVAGIVSMLPNVFPVVVIFGIMGWSEILVDIGTMMTASVAMGVAVDDTIHFLTWFRRGLDEGLNRDSAIMLAYDRCATAMTQTTLIGGLGLSVFALSTFTPTQRFGILMLLLMLAALIGDLIFLPALLAGPAGRIFRPKKVQSTATEPNVVSATATAATPDIRPFGHGRPRLSLRRQEGPHHPPSDVRRRSSR